MVLACISTLFVGSLSTLRNSYRSLLTLHHFGLISKRRQRQSLTIRIPFPQRYSDQLLAIQALAFTFCNTTSSFFFFKIYTNMYFKSLSCVTSSLFVPLSLCLQNQHHIHRSNERNMLQDNETYMQIYCATTYEPLQNCTTMKTRQLSFHQRSHKCVRCNPPPPPGYTGCWYHQYPVKSIS